MLCSMISSELLLTTRTICELPSFKGVSVKDKILKIMGVLTAMPDIQAKSDPLGFALFPSHWRCPVPLTALEVPVKSGD